MLSPAERYSEVTSPEISGNIPTSISVRLRDIAYARSGDKGSGANIGVIAFNEHGYNLLWDNLTADRVGAYFAPMHPGAVQRYALPNLHALNFVLPEILAGGGSRNLRIDPQGKCLGQILLEMELELDPQRFALASRK